jgi:hypothetical protein
MKRRHDDSIKPGCGIDGTEGENFTKVGRVNPSDSNPKDDYLSPQGAGKYQNPDASFLRNKPADDQSGGVGTRDILDNVERNSGTGKPGPIKYGVD